MDINCAPDSPIMGARGEAGWAPAGTALPRPAGRAVKAVFLGNAADYSPAFLAALVSRSLDSEDRVELAGVVCPQRFRNRRDAARFQLKRSAERVLAKWNVGTANLAGNGGPWRRMHLLARQAGVPVLWPRTTSDPAVIDLVERSAADVIVVAGLDRILGAGTIAALPPIFNVHPSLLPAYRGGVPEFWQLAEGQTRGGVTIHRIDAGVDTGPVVARREFDIPAWFDAQELLDASLEPGVALMNELLDAYPDIIETPSPAGGGSYRPLPTDADRAVPFEAPARVVVNRARAVGWSAPLAIHVPAADWRQGTTTAAVGAPTSTTLTLRVRGPIPLAFGDGGPPGTIIRAGAGGVVIVCNPGAVLFRTVEVA